jgi:peptidoglycan/xylan/chitin deacetylase (PgdA/CDA1 family)
MVPERYAYSGIVDRPKVRWPNGARLALWVVPNVELYEYIPPNRVRDPWPRMPHPDVFGYSHRDYGNRVGIWRLFDVVDELNVKCSVSLNLGVFQHFPEVMEACEARKWDIICHGIYNTDHILKLSPEEEMSYINACIEKSKELTGRVFGAWFSPGLSYTHNTVDLIASAGIRYFCDWTFDDHPVRVRTKSGNLFAMPYQLDINDGTFFNRRCRHGDGETFARMIVDYFERMYADSEQQGRVMCIALHPYLIGQPHNIGPFKRALKHIMSHDGVWNATGAEILDWWIGNYQPLMPQDSESAPGVR